jgi:hypothetical protein
MLAQVVGMRGGCLSALRLGGETEPVSQVDEGVGQALMRAPYAWLVTTVLLYMMMLSGLSRVIDDADDGSTVLALAGAGCVLYGVVASLVLLPRFVLPGARQQRSVGTAAFLRWAFATAPFPVCIPFVMAGAKQWVLSVGFFASTLLLVIAARALRREGQRPPE